MYNRDIFVDAGAFFALQAVDDAHHQEASRAFPQILRRYNRLIEEADKTNVFRCWMNRMLFEKRHIDNVLIFL